jgi:flagellar protein FlaG
MEVNGVNYQFHNALIGFLDRVQPEDDKEDEIQLDKKTAVETVDQLNKAFSQMQNQIQFSLDEKSGRMVFYMKDGSTGEVIRQVPDASLLKISQHIAEYLKDVQGNLKKESNSNALSGLMTNANV